MHLLYTYNNIYSYTIERPHNRKHEEHIDAKTVEMQRIRDYVVSSR